MQKYVRRFAGLTVLLLASLASAASAGAQLPPRALDLKVAAYQRKITEAMTRLGASYKISLRPVNSPAETGYTAEGSADVFTEVVRDEEMRNESFIINVTAEFLEKQPEILFEASSLHEVCHVMNDDLTGYHRNGANIETAEEHCVLQAVGESRYEEYLRAYATYQHWDTPTYEKVLQKVKNVELVPAPIETDEADRIAAEYFRTHDDGKEHLLVYNGDLHDETDSEKLKSVIKAGKPMIFFHNHPAVGGRAAMFPGDDDFGVAALISFMVYRENPGPAIEFRVVQTGREHAIVSYGFKGTALKDIKAVALEYREATARKEAVSEIEKRQSGLDYALAQDSFNDYLQYACPVDLARHDAEVCRTHPQYFLWPSDRFFIHYRPQ